MCMCVCVSVCACVSLCVRASVCLCVFPFHLPHQVTVLYILLTHIPFHQTHIQQDTHSRITKTFIIWPLLEVVVLVTVSRNGKGKVHPITGHEGPELGWRYSSTLSLTSALDGGGWITPRSGRFTPGKDMVPIVQEAGWAPRDSLDVCGKSRPHRDTISRPSSR